jgi:hypothetical protein
MNLPSWISAETLTIGELVPRIMVWWGLWLLFCISAMPGEFRSKSPHQRVMGGFAGVVFIYCLYLTGWLIVRWQGLA